MKLGLLLGSSGRDLTLPLDRVLEAEKLGIQLGLEFGSVRL
jgi:hypothetical protein